MTLLLIAQLATLVVLNASGVEVSRQDYTLECGLTPKFVETLPLVDPVEAYRDDPVDPTKDCRALIAAQVQSLPPDQGYRMARLEDGEHVGLSSQFTVSEPPPPPVTTCTYTGVVYTAPTTLMVQLRVATAAADRAAMEANGWTFPQSPSKTNKQWQWWVATCAV